MKIIIVFLLLGSLRTTFAEEYTFKYDEKYSYVVSVTEKELKSIYLAEINKDGFKRIPQTVRIDGFNFAIVCDLESTSVKGLIGLANPKRKS